MCATQFSFSEGKHSKETSKRNFRIAFKPFRFYLAGVLNLKLKTIRRMNLAK